MTSRSRTSAPYASPEAAGGLTSYAVVLLGFAVLCFITAFFFNTRAGKTHQFHFEPAQPDQTHTVEIEDANSTYLIMVSQSALGLRENLDWSEVAVEITSADGAPLMSFGGEFWRASGYDDGYWSEVKNDYDMKVTFPHEGTYRIGIETATNRPQYDEPVRVTLVPKRGSSLPFFVLGILGLLGGVGLGFYANRRSVSKALEEMSAD